MKVVRKVLAVIISLVIAITAIPAMSEKLETKAAESFAITSPDEGKLVAAGHFDIKWSEALESEVKTYKVYLDEKEVGETTSTSLDCYTTKVEKHTAYVVAEYINGTESVTPVITFYVSKKGLAVNNDMGRNLDPLYMNMAWYYTWGTNSFSYTTYKYAEFVPMKWGAGNEESELNAIAKKNYMYLLAYNEPDYPVYDQWGNYIGGSNIKVETAISNWSKFIGKSRYLGAPAPGQSPSWDGGTWFRTFMDRVDHDTIDFIPLHCYYGTYGGAAGANSFLKDVVDKTYQMYRKPIWITEFAVSGWGYSNATARKSLEEFMYTVIDGLNERDYVERYSWFSFDTTNEKDGASALWTNATGELTDLGKIYAFYGNPEGYEPSAVPAPPEEDYKISTGNRKDPYDASTTINGVNCENYIKSGDVTVEASSVNGNHSAEKAIDGTLNNDSRWESKQGQGVDPQTFTINLGTVRNIKQVNILWENAAAKDYYIEVSTDGINYTKVAEASGIGAMGNRNDAIFLKKTVNAQYIRITGTARATQYGYSIWELAVYGTDDAKVDETTTVKPEETTARPVVTRPADLQEAIPPIVIVDEPMSTTTENQVTTKTDVNGPTSGNGQKGTSAIEETAAPTAGQMTTTKLGKTKVKKATKKKAVKKISIKLKKVKGAQKYQIQISKTKKFKKKLVKKTVKKFKFTLKNKKLKNKKKLYVRARAMKVVGKKKYYGNWSKPKKVKIKK